MTAIDFGTTPGWHQALRAGGLVLSLALHGVVAMVALVDPPDRVKKDTWVEMTMVAPPPPPPPPPPPEPEPPKPKPKPKKVAFEDTVKQPPPEAAPPEPQQVRRLTQGLTASSFAQGSGSGIQARAGTTVRAAAGDDTMSIEEAAQSVAFAAVTTQPKCQLPSLEIPESVQEEGIEGTVKVLFDVNDQGTVTNVRVIRKLSPDADAACIAAWKAASCKPGRQGADAVTVTNMPHLCTFKAID